MSTPNGAIAATGTEKGGEDDDEQPIFCRPLLIALVAVCRLLLFWPHTSFPLLTLYSTSYAGKQGAETASQQLPRWNCAQLLRRLPGIG